MLGECVFVSGKDESRVTKALFVPLVDAEVPPGPKTQGEEIQSFDKQGLQVEKGLDRWPRRLKVLAADRFILP